MTIWIVFYLCWSELKPVNCPHGIRLLPIAFIFWLMFFSQPANGQIFEQVSPFYEGKLHEQKSGIFHPKISEYRYQTWILADISESTLNVTGWIDPITDFNRPGLNYSTVSIGSTLQINSMQSDTVPKPSVVYRKSAILPGWGQKVNNQIWKIPVIYGLFAGLTYYSITMHHSYSDYRAAYYNSQNDGDERFGPTPGYINPNENPESLRYSRNTFRNRRDLSFIGIGLVYGLNIIDAYVFAQLRDFDVSDDLSAGLNISVPALTENAIIPVSGMMLMEKITFPRAVTVSLTLNIH